MISNYDKQVDIGRKIFLDYDQEALIRKYTLDADADFLYLTYLGTKCRINRKTGAIDEMIDDIYTECREYTVVMTIYDMLCHGDSPTLPPLSGKWTLVGNFAAAGSSPDANLFAQKYADAFSGKTDALKDACRPDMAAYFEPGFSAESLELLRMIRDFLSEEKVIPESFDLDGWVDTSFWEQALNELK